MGHEDPTRRYAELFMPSSYQSNAGSSSKQSLPGSSGASAAPESVRRKRTSAATTLRNYFDDNAGPADNGSDSSLENLGQTARSTQHWDIDSKIAAMKKQTKQKEDRSVSRHSGNTISRTSPSRPKSSSQSSQEVYTKSTSSAHTRASKPYSVPDSRAKGKERAVEASKGIVKANLTQATRNEDERPKSHKTKSDRSPSAIQARSTDKNERSQGHFEVVPFEAPQSRVTVPDYLFTPPSAKAKAALDSKSSQEKFSAQHLRQDTSYKQVNGKERRQEDYRRQSHDAQNDDSHHGKQNDKERRKKFAYQEIGDEIASQVEAYSSTRGAEVLSEKSSTIPFIGSWTPKTRTLLQNGEAMNAAKESRLGQRSPVASRAIKSGSSAVKRATPKKVPNLEKKRVATEKEQSMLSGNSGPARSSSPSLRLREKQRIARPAATNKAKIQNGALQVPRMRSASSSSSSSAPSTTSRQPLADKQISSSSSKSSLHNGKNAQPGRRPVTDLTLDSPNKSQHQLARLAISDHRPITLASGIHGHIDTDEEDSVVVADSSTINKSGSSDPTRSIPISSQDIEAEVRRRDRGAPTPVFGKRSPTKKERPRARPSASRSRPFASTIQPMSVTVLESSGAMRLATPEKSPRKRMIESAASPSTSKRRATQAESSRQAMEREKRRQLRRSTSSTAEPPSLQRSDSPFEHTQVLWRKAANSDGFEDADLDLMDSDSDDDIPVARFENIVLCPFCDLPLPARPSQELIEQLTKLCNRVDLEIRPSSLNSMALRLPATETAFACKRHQDESDIIPAGEAAGYPKAGDIHWSLVAKRIQRNIVPELAQIVSGRKESSFYDNACKEWEEHGARKMSNMRNQYSSFYLELPGYYGQRGLAVFLEVLNTEFVSRGHLNPQTAAPLDVEVYLRRVLVPETAVRLIEWDQRCTRSKALEILEESREYGSAVYGDTELSERFFKQTQAEKSRRAKEEEIAVSRREDLISSQGDAGEALRLGEAFIAKLRKCMHRA